MTLVDRFSDRLREKIHRRTYLELLEEWREEARGWSGL